MFFKLSTSITVSTYAFLPSSSPSQQSLLSRYLRCVHIAHTDTAAKSLPTLCDPIDGSPLGLLCPWDSPGKNTGVGCHFLLQCMKVKSESEVAQSCPTLSNPMDCSLLGSSIHGIFQARILEWVAIAFSAYRHRDTLKVKCYYSDFKT